MEKNFIEKHLLIVRQIQIPAKLTALLPLLLLVSFFAQAQDSKVTPNVATNTAWVNGGAAGFSGFAATQVAGAWNNIGNVVNSNVSDNGNVTASGNAAVGTLSPSGTLSIKDPANAYSTTAFTGYYIGFLIDRQLTGTATTLLSTFNYTISTYLGGVSTTETATGNTFSTDIGGYFHKPFDEVRLQVSGGFPYVFSVLGNSTAQIQVKNAYLRRYTRTLACNVRTPLVGPGLSATLTSASVGGWALGSEANLEDNATNTGALYGAVLGTGTYTASVKDDAVVYKAGVFGGFRLVATSILGGSLLSSSTVQLRMNGAVVDTRTGAQLLGGSILNSDGTITVGIVASAPFDEVVYSNVDVGLAVGQTLLVSYPVIESFCDNPISNLACNTPTNLHEGDGTNVNFPVHVTSGNISVACLECSVDNPDRVIDNDPNNYAEISQLASVVTSVYLGVKSEQTGGYPAGTFVGFDLEDINVISAGAANIHTITTYNAAGQLVDTYSDGSLIGGTIFNTSGRNLVGFKATAPFSEIRLTVGKAISTGVASTRVYNVVIERFCPSTVPAACNTVVPLVRNEYPAFIDAKNTGINSAASVQNTIDNTSRLIDSDLTNYATITTLASGNVTASVAVQNGGDIYPAGTFAGFDLSNPSLIGGGFLNSVVITTLDASGAVVESVNSAGSLFAIGSSVATGTGRQTIGFLATQPFTGVKLTYNKTVSGDIGEIRVYNAVTETFCVNGVLACGQLTPVTNPNYPVFVDSRQTGFFGIASAGNSINNSQSAIDADPATFAAVTLGATLGTTASFAVANAKETYPAETYAGFDIGSVSLFNAGVLSSMTITLYNNGIAVQNSTGTALLGGVTSSLVTDGYNRNVVGVVGHVPFDEVKITFANGAAVDLGVIRIYGAVFQQFLKADGTQYCPVVIDCKGNILGGSTNPQDKTISAVVNYERTGVTGVAAAGYEVANPWNVVSANLTDFATLYNAASGAAQASLSVATPGVIYPAGTFAGFTIKKNPSILAAALFPQITVTTYLKGAVRETKTGGALADFTLFTQWFGTPTDFYNPGFKATLSFDEIQITVASLASFSDHHIDVYGAYVDTRESTPTTGDGSTTIACSVPDLKPTLLLSPSTTYGVTTVNVTIRVLEINKVASTGPTQVWLRRINNISATNLVVNNSYNGWIYKGLSGGYYKFEHPEGLIAEGVSTRINFTITLDNLGSVGSTSLRADIPVTGIGGETNFENNSASGTWVYYNN